MMINLNIKASSRISGRRMHQPKHLKYNNKDEDNSPNDKNDQASSQKFKQIKNLTLSITVLQT